jgi:cellulose synthase/poly-beta-1,6-N-acetylglucosamine synthase-like glycosyltransferase
VTIALTSQIRPWPIRVGSAKPSISIIIAVYNEAATIARRLDEFVRVIGAWDHGQAEIIVVSDGSTDSTAAIARSFAERGVQLFEQASNQGKAAALNLGARVACNEILILADARQIWSETAIDCLLENFSDPSVGAVGGELILRGSNGMLVGVGLYWRFEKWLRKCESKVHSTVGVTGAICAVRRRLFPILPDTVRYTSLELMPMTVCPKRYQTNLEEKYGP